MGGFLHLHQPKRQAVKEKIISWVLSNKTTFLLLARTLAESTSNEIDDKLVEFLELILKEQEGGAFDWLFSSLEKGAAMPIPTEVEQQLASVGLDTTKNFQDAKEFIPSVSSFVKLAA